ncbi:Na-translocating system protein MpsC family protein [Brevibacillus composti]|uniref:Na-translocating system protein MpsC family protein n=1 Tax=Brevibacillus composti TaxID=2796470 RepID=UPI00226B59F7|nr:Na-translocating system protein MpsC family protein [Brevibacillus composti]
MERILLQQDEIFTIGKTRDLLMKNLMPELVAYMKIATGVEIREVYYDWSLHNKSGVIVAICSEPIPFSPEIIEEYHGKERIHEEINSISMQVQKYPEEIFSYQTKNRRTIIVVRSGILVAIEKELIRLGFRETLKIAKREF